MTHLSTPPEGLMAAAIDASLVDEYSRLLTEHMTAAEMGLAPRLCWTASLSDVSAVIGPRYAYLALRRASYVPGAGDTWTRAARHSNPAELSEVETLDIDDLAPALNRARACLDPLGLFSTFEKVAA